MTPTLETLTALALTLAILLLLNYAGAPITRRRVTLRETKARAERECGEVNR